MPELLVRKLYDTLAPFDKENADVMNQLEPNEIYRVKVSKVRSPKDAEELFNQRRSNAQNRIMWIWLTDMEKTQVNEYAGTTKEEWHITMKRKFLIQIYERDSGDENYPALEGYAELVSAIRNVYESGLKKEFDLMLDFIAERTSTTIAKVKQMAEYLRSIELYCHDCGIRLRTDIPIYQEAFNEYQ